MWHVCGVILGLGWMLLFYLSKLCLNSFKCSEASSVHMQNVHCIIAKLIREAYNYNCDAWLIHICIYVCISIMLLCNSILCLCIYVRHTYSTHSKICIDLLFPLVQSDAILRPKYVPWGRLRAHFDGWDSGLCQRYSNMLLHLHVLTFMRRPTCLYHSQSEGLFILSPPEFPATVIALHLSP